MELLTLNLRAPIEWREEEGRGPVSFATAAAAMDSAPDGAERALFWDWDAAVDSSGDDGPRAARPLPSPAICAASPDAASPDAASPDAAAPTVGLAPGRYHFAQARKPEGATDAALEAWLADQLEWFAREAWWSRAESRGRLVVRLVREDGKTAVQLIRQIP
jgi:hypothetical protein